MTIHSGGGHRTPDPLPVVWPLLLVVAVTLTAVALRNSRHAGVSLRVSRWTYAIVFPLSLLYFPIQSNFRLQPVQCEWTFGPALAVHSLTNVAHTVLFAIFFALTWAQFRGAKRRMLWSFALSFVMGFAVEIAEGITRIHHCRMRDLIPDMVGAAAAAVILLVALRVAARGTSA